MLQELLEEVAKMDLTGNSVDWRRIASRINHFSKETGCHYSVFYGGEQCMNFFVREIVKPIKCQTYDIGCYDKGRMYRNFWEDLQNKILIERAVSNYNKSVESFGGFSHTIEKDGCEDGIFEKFHSIFRTLMFYFAAIETLCFIVMILAFIMSMIAWAIFNSFTTT